MTENRLGCDRYIQAVKLQAHSDVYCLLIVGYCLLGKKTIYADFDQTETRLRETSSCDWQRSSPRTSFVETTSTNVILASYLRNHGKPPNMNDYFQFFTHALQLQIYEDVVAVTRDATVPTK